MFWKNIYIIRVTQSTSSVSSYFTPFQSSFWHSSTPAWSTPSGGPTRGSGGQPSGRAMPTVRPQIIGNKQSGCWVSWPEFQGKPFSHLLFQSAWSFSSLSPGPPSTSRDSAMSTSSRPFSLERSISICSISLVRWHPDISANVTVMWFPGILYYLSSTLNPLLYTLMSVKYRQAFKNVMLCRTSK